MFVQHLTHRSQSHSSLWVLLWSTERINVLFLIVMEVFLEVFDLQAEKSPELADAHEWGRSVNLGDLGAVRLDLSMYFSLVL